MLNATSMLVIPTFILPAQSLSWVPDYLSSYLLTWPPGCLIGIQMFSSPKRTLDPLPSTPQPPVFLISVHGLNIHSTFTHSFHQQAPSSLPSMYIKLQSLLHHATSHCHELPQMCLSFLLVSPLFSTVSSTQRWFKNFNKSCHSCSYCSTSSATSPWSGLSWPLQFIPSSSPLTHFSLVPVTILLSLHHVTGIPNLGLVQTLLSLTRRHPADFDLTHSSMTLKYLLSNSASSKSSSRIAYLFSSHFLLPSFFFMWFIISWYYLIYLLLYYLFSFLECNFHEGRELVCVVNYSSPIL